MPAAFLDVVGQQSEVVVEVCDRVVLDRLALCTELLPVGRIGSGAQSALVKPGVHVIQGLQD